MGADDRGPGYIVRASELNSFEYCRRAWWLRYVAGLEPDAATLARLDAGTQRHVAHGRTVRLAGLLHRIGLLLLLIGLLLGGMWWLTALLH